MHIIIGVTDRGTLIRELGDVPCENWSTPRSWGGNGREGTCTGARILIQTRGCDIGATDHNLVHC